MIFVHYSEEIHNFKIYMPKDILKTKVLNIENSFIHKSEHTCRI